MSRVMSRVSLFYMISKVVLNLLIFLAAFFVMTKKTKKKEVLQHLIWDILLCGYIYLGYTFFMRLYFFMHVLVLMQAPLADKVIIAHSSDTYIYSRVGRAKTLHNLIKRSEERQRKLQTITDY